MTTVGPVNYDEFGRPLMIRDSQTATNTFGTYDYNLVRIPKSNFLFYVKFMRSDTSNLNGTSLDWSRGVGLYVTSVDRPSLQYDVTVLNQYNKKRLIQKAANTQAIDIYFHDTIDNMASNMLEEYYKFYYGQASATDVKDWAWDITANEMINPNQGNWGYDPPKVSPNNSYFFSHIEIYQLYGSRYTRIDVTNPKITSVKYNALDYSDSKTSNIFINVDYEGIIYKGNNIPLTQDLITEMGLDMSNFYEPSEEPGYYYPMSDTSYIQNGLGIDININNLFGINAGISLPVSRTLQAGDLTNPMNSIVGGILEFDNGNDVGTTVSGSTNSVIATNQLKGL